MTSTSAPHAQAPTPEPIDEATSESRAELDRFGITSRQHTIYEWNGFRYSNAADAIAAAKRAAR